MVKCCTFAIQTYNSGIIGRCVRLVVGSLANARSFSREGSACFPVDSANYSYTVSSVTLPYVFSYTDCTVAYIYFTAWVLCRDGFGPCQIHEKRTWQLTNVTDSEHFDQLINVSLLIQLAQVYSQLYLYLDTTMLPRYLNFHSTYQSCFVIPKMNLNDIYLTQLLVSRLTILRWTTNGLNASTRQLTFIWNLNGQLVKLVWAPIMFMVCVQIN